MRAVAASAVLVSHAWPLTLGKGAAEPLKAATGYTLGATAVIIFFAVSGFFITKSFLRRNSLADFAVARVARIYPALLVVLLLTVLVLGPLVTDLPLRNYVTDLRTWTYLPRNALFWCQYELPGSFSANPFPGAINGSLWTLYYEVACYIFVVVFGLIGLLRRSTLPIVLVAALLPALLVPQTGAGFLAGASTLILPFALGAAAYVYRDHVPVSAALTVALIGVAVAAHGTVFYPAAHALALAYGALWFGLVRLPLINRYNQLGDVSYGLYIYAFPVEQLLVRLGLARDPWTLIACALPVTVLAATASWLLIESPALARRHHILDGWDRFRTGTRRADQRSEAAAS